VCVGVCVCVCEWVEKLQVGWGDGVQIRRVIRSTVIICKLHCGFEG
jgi:hypothetical protein